MAATCGACSDPDHPPDSDTESWRTIQFGGSFTISVPGDTVYTAEPGTDSIAGEITGRGFRLRFDFGLYSDPLEKIAGLNPRSKELKTVNGREALLVTGPITDGVIPVGIHFAELRKTTLGTIKLTLAGFADNAETLTRVRRILTSVEIADAPRGPSN